jgi:hypothetical protein
VFIAGGSTGLGRELAISLAKQGMLLNFFSLLLLLVYTQKLNADRLPHHYLRPSRAKARGN